jgi:hypothetical protein
MAERINRGHTMKYRLEFLGRKVGAIGIFYQISVTLEASTEDEARLKIYDTHEHISGLKVTEVSE